MHGRILTIRHLEILEFGKEKKWSYKAVTGPCGGEIFVLAIGDIPFSDWFCSSGGISCLLIPGKLTHWTVLCSLFSMTTSKVLILEHILLGGWVIYVSIACFLLVRVGEFGSCFIVTGSFKVDPWFLWLHNSTSSAINIVLFVFRQIQLPHKNIEGITISFWSLHYFLPLVLLCFNSMWLHWRHLGINLSLSLSQILITAWKLLHYFLSASLSSNIWWKQKGIISTHRHKIVILIRWKMI